MSASVVLRRRLGNQLRELRLAAGLHQEQLAERLDVSLKTIQRVEAAENTIRAGHLTGWLEACGADRETRERLTELGQQARKRGGWWSTYRDLLAGPYVQLEDEATMVCNYESSLIPGLLHTEEYARAVITSDATVHEEELERRTAARMKRQERLTGDNPLELRAVVDEAALRRPAGGPQVMRAQLERMVELAELPNISIRVIPFSAGTYLANGLSFVILKFAHPIDPDIVIAETLAGEKYFDQAEELSMYNSVFEETRALALKDEDSVKLVERLMAE